MRRKVPVQFLGGGGPAMASCYPTARRHVALGKRTWIAGALGLLLGLAIGAGAMHLWLPRASTSHSRTTPTEADPPLDGKIVIKALGRGGNDPGLGLVTLFFEPSSTSASLKDVELVLVLWQENGEKQEIKRYWAEWPAAPVTPGQVVFPTSKTIRFPPNIPDAEKIEVRGTAMQGDKRVRIEASQGPPWPL